MTESAFSDPRSTATIINEARKGRAGSNPALITRCEELEARLVRESVPGAFTSPPPVAPERPAETFDRPPRHGGPVNPPTEGLGDADEVLEIGDGGGWLLTDEGREALRRSAGSMRDGGVVRPRASDFYEHSEPVGSVNPASFIKIEGMEEQRSIVEEAQALVAGGDVEFDGTPEEVLKAVATMWEGIFPCVINPQQVAAAMMSFAVCRESSVPSDRSNFVDMISYALIWAQLEGHSEPPPT